MSSLSPEQIRKIAQLSRLALKEEEIPKLAGQLNDILKHIEILNTLNTDGIEATAHAFFVPTPLRPDEVETDTTREASLTNAPDRDGDFFKVPRVLG